MEGWTFPKGNDMKIRKRYGLALYGQVMPKGCDKRFRNLAEAEAEADSRNWSRLHLGLDGYWMAVDLRGGETYRLHWKTDFNQYVISDEMKLALDCITRARELSEVMQDRWIEVWRYVNGSRVNVVARVRTTTEGNEEVEDGEELDAGDGEAGPAR